jgi:hypothetical protein
MFDVCAAVWLPHPTGLHFRAGDGVVLDVDGVPITHVWKTWNWETLMLRWTQSGETLRTSGDVRVLDVCMAPSVTVYERGILIFTFVPIC